MVYYNIMPLYLYDSFKTSPLSINGQHVSSAKINILFLGGNEFSKGLKQWLPVLQTVYS